MVRATGADSSCFVERSVLPLIIIDGGAGRGRMRAVRADAPEEAGEERHDADPPLLEGERDVGMRGVLTGMLSKLLSQVGEERRVAAVEESATASDERLRPRRRSPLHRRHHRRHHHRRHRRHHRHH